MKLVAFALIVLSSIAASSGFPVTLKHSSEVTQVIASSRQEVLLLAQSLRSRAVANSLRKAIVEGGIALEILCDANSIQEPSNFIPVLSMLRKRNHRVAVRILRGVNRAVLIVDQSRAMFGALVGEPDSFGLTPTRLVTDALEVRQHVRAFKAQWQRATPWVYTVQPPRFTTGGRK